MKIAAAHESKHKVAMSKAGDTVDFEPSEVVQDWAQWLTTASDILHGVHASRSCTCHPETGVQTQPTGSQY